jgi:L-alanine-DL-glutamate epimerase-like enolase superfamily enzyme
MSMRFRWAKKRGAPLESPITINNVEAFVFRAPVTKPVKTSFGTMTNRPAVFVRLEDEDGIVGWGEIWCNFPNCAAEHRAKLLEENFKAPLLNKVFNSPEEIYQDLSKKTAILAIQSGEYGPIAQVIAGIDLAAWDLFSKKSGQPLWRYLGGTNPTIKTYASGINPDKPENVVEELLKNGYKAFKLKIGFNHSLDLQNIHNIQTLIPKQILMVDANQAWDLPTAIKNIQAMEGFDLNWVEEPIRADNSIANWQELSRSCNTRLAAGENMASERSFNEAIASKTFSVIQPDIAKWGGISGCLPVIKNLEQHGIEYCPHYLGGAIGLLSSAHLLAASNSNGMLEIDSNPNPLRVLKDCPTNTLSDGCITLSESIGLGFEPDLDHLAPFLIH